MNRKTKALIRGALIASIYVILTYLSNLFGLANGAIQVRLSEMLCVFAIFLPESIAGLTLGCLLSNIFTGCIAFDVIFGSLATLIGAVGTYIFRKHKIPALMCPVISNMFIVPLILKYAYGLQGAWWYMVVTVGIGEFVSCVLLGSVLAKLISKNRRFFD